MGKKLYDYDVQVMSRKIRVKAPNAKIARNRAAKEYNRRLLKPHILRILEGNAHARRVRK